MHVAGSKASKSRLGHQPKVEKYRAVQENQFHSFLLIEINFGERMNAWRPSGNKTFAIETIRRSLCDQSAWENSGAALIFG